MGRLSDALNAVRAFGGRGDAGKAVDIRMVLGAKFLDRAPFIRAVDKASRRVLSRFGAFVRTRARTNLRRRKRPSKPGQAPTNQTGRLKRHIFFWYDRGEQRVTIGPIALNARSPAVIPEVLEYGGHAVGFRRDKRTGKDVRWDGFLEPRPYIRPAFDQELAKMDPLWRDSVRAGI